MLRTIFNWALRLGPVIILCLGTLVACHYYHRPGLPEYTSKLADPNANNDAPTTISLSWHGVTAVVIEDANTRLFIDPFFSRPEGWWPLVTNQTISPDIPRIRQGLIDANATKLDAVLVSHSHFDHAMDAPAVAAMSNATLYGSASTSQLGIGADLPADRNRTITPGQPVSIGDFTVTFFTSEHAGFTGGRPTGDITQPLSPPKPPATYLDYKQGGTFSILIEHPAGNILHHGSAGFIEGALDNVQADIVLLGIAIRPGLETYYQNTIDVVGATRVLPTHWDDFTVKLPANNLELPKPMPFGVSLDAFIEETQAIRPEIELITLRINQPYIAY